MTNTPRYAIYYAPAPDSRLDRFGAHLLGYDAFRGEEIAFPSDIEQQAPDWRALTSDPRRYGFHATLKAPLALAPGMSEGELLAACAAFAATPRTIPLIHPVVGSISGFIAVIPAQPSAELIQLAADCVRAFDPFRAPLTPTGRARRNPLQLTPRQRDYLDRWGYPYVMQEFRFHMTLTGRLAAERREPVLAMLQDRFAAIEPKTIAIDRIAVFREDYVNARFRVVGQYLLTSASN
jgi:putative phosphonate metabolism protein